MTENTPQPAGPMSEAEERNQAKTMFIINGFFPLLGGLIFWLMNKDRSAFIDRNGKEAVNFGITVWAAYVAFWILIFILTIATLGLGSLLSILGLGIWIYSIVMGFTAGGQAEKGVDYRFPFNPLRLIK